MQAGIHNYEKTLNTLTQRIRDSKLSEKNKRALMSYDRALLLIEGLSKPRRIRLLGTIFLLARTYFRGDLSQVVEEQIKDCIKDIQSKANSPWTVAAYKIAIKKFFKWLAYGDAVMEREKYPKKVAWIRVHVKRKDQPKVQASSILTEDEAHRLIAAAQFPRDRAFVSLIYELGARIGEIGNLCIGDLTHDKDGYIIDLKGKTGHRTPRAVMSDPYLTEWIDYHPLNKDPAAPLWICPDRKGGWEKMMYGALRALLLRLKEKSGITKRLYAHLFRHSRVTHLLGKGLLNEAQAKVYFGWTPDSHMLSDYAHLVSQDANDAILKMHGIKVENQVKKQEMKTCPRCKRINAVEAKFCIDCSSILDPDLVFREDQQQVAENKFLEQIMSDETIKRIVAEKLLSMDIPMLKKVFYPENDRPEKAPIFKS